MKKNFTVRFLAVLLSITLITGNLSVDVLAAYNGLDEVVDTIPTMEEGSMTDGEPEAYIVAEEEELRTETTKTFRRRDGSYVLAMYDSPVHYENEQGEMEEIDNTFVQEKPAEGALSTQTFLTEQGEQIYSNRGGKNQITFVRKQGETGATDTELFSKENLLAEEVINSVSMELEENQLTWHYIGMLEGEIVWEMNSETSKNGDEEFLAVERAVSRGKQENAFPNTDVIYTVLPEGIKEDIVL